MPIAENFSAWFYILNKTLHNYTKARCNNYSRILKHAENHFQRAFNVTQQLCILVLYHAEMFFADFNMAAVFLAKPERRDHSLKRDESIDVSSDPP
jgi:hypothetical protein